MVSLFKLSYLLKFLTGTRKYHFFQCIPFLVYNVKLDKELKDSEMKIECRVMCLFALCTGIITDFYCIIVLEAI